jgi:hypothetical protein
MHCAVYQSHQRAICGWYLFVYIYAKRNDKTNETKRTGQDHKLTHLDEKTIRDLVGEEEDDDGAAAANDEAAKLKARNRLKNRIAQEKKARNRSGGGNDDDEDDEDVSAFAKKKGR